LERAFELARDSSCRNLEDIRRQLAAERYSQVAEHLAGSSVRKQITALIAHRK
jgi:hypothetical protein